MIRVGAVDELWEDELTPTVVAGVPVLLVRTATGVHAYEDRCAHLGVRLSEGTLDGRVLTCRAHHWQYDVVTGRGINPQTACLSRFAVEIREGAIYVDVGQRT
jgi:toluene monooxygenase system ferredoxin subunit